MALGDSTPRGHRSAFRPDFIEQARRLAALGTTDAQLAELFGVDAQTFDRWKDQHPEFWQALEESRTEANARSAGSLSGRAAAFSRTAGEILGAASFERHNPVAYFGRFAFDATALIAWLKHRRPDPPDDRVPGGRTGKDGKPDENEVPEMSTYELARRVAFLLASADQTKRNAGASGNPATLSSSTTSTGEIGP